MTIFSGGMPKLPGRSGLAGWIRAVASRFVNDGEPQGLDRTEIARDLNLSPPEPYALPFGPACC